MAKMTLLKMVQKILSDMDGEEINALGDTTESTQIASIIEDTFYNMFENRVIPEHEELVKLTALSDTDFPTHFSVPTNTSNIECVWYDVSEDDTFEYREIKWKEPEDFLSMVDSRSGTAGTDFKNVSDKNAGTNLRIYTDRQPTYYTSFDDLYLVFDSHDISVDTTLKESKSRSLAKVTPVFDSTSDSYTPDIDANYFPALLAESKSVAFSLLKGGSDPKVDQAARRQKYRIQNDKYNITKTRSLSNYGRS
jgi:hypothetical protein